MQNQYLSTFTPSLMSAETLEAIFVQREELAQDLITGIRESILTQNKHYRLLTGMRGIGKTHTIALIYHRLRDQADLKDKLIIAWLKEEEWGISSWLDLQIRIFQALNNLYPAEYQSKLAADVEALYQLSPHEAEIQGETILKEFISNRTLLLLTENLDEIFAGLKDKGQKKLRAYLQNHNLITIVATSQSLFNGITSKNSAFYGFFNPQSLDKLSLTEATKLLTKIAQFKKDPELETFVRSQTGKERIQAIHHLAGGNHRVYIIFSQFLTRDSLDDLVQPVMQTLDELTPYYQSRMQWLSPQQRKIIELLCDRRGAVAVKEIAQRCFITHQTASSQLRDLIIKGYVGKEIKGRESFYELQEPLMRICLEAKKQRGETIKLFVDFLRIWYTNRELKSRLEQLPENCLERNYILKALELEPILSEASLINESDENNNLFEQLRVYYEQKDYQSMLDLCDQQIAINSENHRLWFVRSIALDELGRYEAAIQSYDRALEINPEHYPSWCNRGTTLKKSGKYEAAIESYDRALEINPKDYLLWFYRGITFKKIGKYEAAMQSYDHALEINPEHYLLWFYRGVALDELGEYEAAIESYDRALKINPEHDPSWNNRGNTLAELGEYEAAIESYERALEINPEHDPSWFNRGNALAELGKYEAAIESYDHALEINPEHYLLWFYSGNALAELDKYEAAIEFYDHALEINPEHYRLWHNRGNALYELGKHEVAIQSYNRAITLNNKTSLPLFGLGKVLFKLDRWEEGFTYLQQGLELANLKDDYLGDITAIVKIIFESKQKRDIWQDRIQTLVKLYDRHQVVSELATGIIENIPNLFSKIVSNKAAQTWLEIWQEVVKDKPELEIPLRWLKTAVEYKTTKGDRRILLQLPKEERDLFKTLLKDEQE